MLCSFGDIPQKLGHALRFITERRVHFSTMRILNLQFVAERPHPVWMTDITYIATDEGWLYLARVEDLYSRQIVGWAMSERMTQDLVLQAFDQAADRRAAPFRLREPVRGPSLSRPPGGADDSQHEPERELLGQCLYRILA